ncbi:MAG: hypothetical protein NC299_18050, partial [Lachnospiraceae bacterium]|nr:hypothetical protein [Lachnospiraceae bacterium]
EPEFNNYSPDVLIISGDVSGVEIGDYAVFFDIADKNNYEWASSVDISRRNGGKAAVSWEIIYSAKTAKIPYQSNYLVYDGKSLSPVFANYDKGLMTLIGGVPSKTDAGKYAVVFGLKDNCVWSDGSTGNKTVEWNIYKRPVPEPYIKTSSSEGGMYYYEFEGKRYPIWANYDADIMTLSGDTYDVDNTWHNTYFDLNDPDNYEWESVGNSSRYTVRWKLSVPYEPSYVPDSNDKKVHIPKQVKIPVEDGTMKYPSWDRFDTAAIEKIGGVWEAVSADTYYVVLELLDGYVWEDGTYEVKTVPWKILSVGEEVPDDSYNLIPIHIPVQINIPDYDGLVKEPEWDEWDKFGIDIVEGDLYGMPAGTYYLTLRPQTGYIWENGIVEDKVVTWVINPRDLEEIPDDPVPRAPLPEVEEQENSENGCCCCCTPCCDTGVFNIFKCADDDGNDCDCS